jgi:hypothetical protein
MLWDYPREKHVTDVDSSVYRSFICSAGKREDTFSLKRGETQACARPSVAGGTPDLKRANENTGGGGHETNATVAARTRQSFGVASPPTQTIPPTSSPRPITRQNTPLPPRAGVYKYSLVPWKQWQPTLDRHALLSHKLHWQE